MHGKPHTPTEVVALSSGGLEKRQQRRDMTAGWTIKGIPTQTVDMTRQAARKRGMRIGMWVAEALHKAATAELEDWPTPDGPDKALSEKLDKFAETLSREMHEISDQTKALDQELGVIRRGLLPCITGKSE